jgi:hypothetical protein
MWRALLKETDLPIGFIHSTLDYSPQKLYFGDENLDRLFQGFRPRQIIYLHGSEKCLHLAEILCVRAQLPVNKGGIDSKVIFIDGGSGLDVSAVAGLSRQSGQDKTAAPRNIILSRAFTCFQLTNLIETRLEETLEDTASKLVVVSDFPVPYCDQDLEESIAREQFCRALTGLVTIVKSRDAIALVTSSREEPKQAMTRLGLLLKRRCNIAARVVTRGSIIRVILEKHPSALLHSVDITTVADRVLRRFLETELEWEEQSPHTERL